jgi:hypothetical protein
MTEPMFDGVLAILVDGARPDVMKKLAHDGRMPVFKEHFVDRGGMTEAASVFPTVSGPAHFPLLCGVHPGAANLPGIRWAERPSGTGGFWGRTRSYMAPGRGAKLERDVPAHIRTLFQRIDGLADVNTWFVRGCPEKARFTRVSKGAAFLRALTTTDWYGSDGQAENATIKALEAGYTSVHAVFPAVDELGHRCGPLTDESMEAYVRFDQRLGRVVDALARLGRLDRTLMMLTSDHGQTTTHTHVSLEDLVEEVIPKTVAYPRLWRHSHHPEAAVMVSGNSMANVYIRGEKTWDERPDVERAGSPASDIRERLLAHDAIDQLIYRRTDGTILVANSRGRAVVTVPAHRDGEQPPFLDVQIEGENPLGSDSPTGRITRARGLAGIAAEAYPDAAWQLWNFYRSPRAGDLVVCAKEGFDLRTRFEYQPHKGSHGTLSRDHMLVPAAVNARWPAGTHPSSVDLCPTILAALGKELTGPLDGRAIPLTRD